MHADHVLGSGAGLGDLRDGEGRGIGREDAVRTNVLLDLERRTKKKMFSVNVIQKKYTPNKLLWFLRTVSKACFRKSLASACI